jgi:hypothetical protein
MPRKEKNAGQLNQATSWTKTKKFLKSKQEKEDSVLV